MNDRREHAVGMVNEGELFVVAEELELGENGEKGFDKLEVFLRLNAACGVDKPTTRGKALEVGGKEEALLGKELLSAFGSVAPTGIWTTTKNTRVGAREVE